ncbi:hypothetical protein BJX66DRAFT_180986 [Aspergillus keveii]|uniref:Uncharacterized protein n=1 Tax=Aspergillus keveii TaxID=714993 RepID=A0ABR4GNN5_9EURO
MILNYHLSFGSFWRIISSNLSRCSVNTLAGTCHVMVFIIIIIIKLRSQAVWQLSFHSRARLHSLLSNRDFHQSC